jgi:hypothetical protein
VNGLVCLSSEKFGSLSSFSDGNCSGTLDENFGDRLWQEGKAEENPREISLTPEVLIDTQNLESPCSCRIRRRSSEQIHPT